MALNVVAFQAGWLACVLSAAYGSPAAGLAAAAAVVAWHATQAARPAQELKLVAMAVLIGVFWDSALVALGWLAFAPYALLEKLAPYWILALWAMFATTLNVSLGWLRGRWLLAALLGALAGPLSYWAGAKLGAVVLLKPVPALAALAIGWAVILPALLALARRFDGFAAR
jgi:uncharacterized protein DUF2878